MFIENPEKDFYNILHGKRLLLFVHYDIDAICACKIMQQLLRCDNIVYTLVPVQGISDLVTSYNEISKEAKYVLLINCGGTVDIVELLQPEEDVIFFIVDSHRPADLCNVYSSGQVRILTKSTENDDIPEFEQIFKDDESDEEESDEGSDDGEDRQAKRQRLAEQNILKRRERRLWEEERNKLMFDYSQFTYYSHSSAAFMFDLSCRLSKDNNDLLWWSIIGVTEQLILAKSDSSDYIVENGNIQGQVSRLNADTDSCSDVTSLKITFNNELQLALYRHWSVEESLRNSMYSACQLKMWTLRGEKKLCKMLADLGLPLAQARQKFNAMDLTLRNEFSQMMEKAASSEEYKLSNLSYPSFNLRYGFRNRFTPADYVYAMVALLEHNQHNQPPRECFLEALDSLTRSSKPTLENGIERAKNMLVLTFKQVQGLMNLRQVISAGPFLYLILQEGSLDGRMFAKPHLLTLLATFTLRAFVAASRNARATRIPLIASAPLDVEAGTCLVVGVPPVSEEAHKNFFGKAFERAGETAGVQIVMDNFDSSVAQLAASDRIRFFDALTSLLS